MSRLRPIRFETMDSEDGFELEAFRLIVAGYTARDSAAVQKHIDELAEIGVRPPDSVPAFYEVDPDLATQEGEVTVDGVNTSGEVEPVLVRHGGRLFLGVGSDHTDRDIERISIAQSKSACPKPVSRQVVEVADGFDWSTAVMRSTVDGDPYQEGPLRVLRPTIDVMNLFGAPADDDLIVFGGTVPLLGGVFVPGRHWAVELDFGDGRALRHEYRVAR